MASRVWLHHWVNQKVSGYENITNFSGGTCFEIACRIGRRPLPPEQNVEPQQNDIPKKGSDKFFLMTPLTLCSDSAIARNSRKGTS
jgi:hypothetical protein